jgi:hypothetical protein
VVVIVLIWHCRRHRQPGRSSSYWGCEGEELTQEASELAEEVNILAQELGFAKLRKKDLTSQAAAAEVLAEVLDGKKGVHAKGYWNGRPDRERD